MKFINLLAIFILMFSIQSVSQIRWMPNIVLGASNVTNKNPNNNIKYHASFSYSLGFIIQHDFMNNLSLRSGMNMNMFSAHSNQDSGYSTKTPVMTIPIQIMGRFGGEKVKFVIGFGPSLAVKLGGQSAIEYASSDYKFGGADGQYARFNLNLIPFAGIDLNNKIGIYFNYNFEALNSRHGNGYAARWSQMGFLLGIYI